ncbi:hypothetical protein [Pinibacter soli]|uniref:Uncharacterized protein n=1 Tax=Pinibacter soli TaxID=3044211 RepID=A0ABT6RH90_9BACT|nr:hypothetical protein [Pinibacter soli]MDI3321941.1 hypothetical protein [Pinibacter soli]
MKTRVSEGGHNIEPEVIERRYIGGLRNLFDIYLEIVDEILIFDNSEGTPDLIALKIAPQDIQVSNQKMYDNLKFLYGRNK